MKTRTLLTSLGIISALALTGCSDDAAASEGLGEREDIAAEDGLGGAEAVTEFEAMYATAVEEGQTTVNLYTPLTATWPSVFEAFQERFPEITVQPLQVVGAELDTKVSQEQASGQRIADAVITGDTGAVALAERDYFGEFRPFNLEEASDDPQFSLEEGTLTAVSASPRGFIYDTRQDVGVVPGSWEDLLDPALEGKITMTNPATDGGGMQMADLLLHEESLGEDYLNDLAAQNISFSSNTAECHNAVVQGRAYVCLMGAMGNFMTLTADGAPVELTHPVEGGNWATSWYAGIIDGAENAKAAQLLTTWLNTPEANEIKGEAGHGPIANAENVDLAFEDPLNVPLLPRPDLADVTERQKSSKPIITEIFD